LGDYVHICPGAHLGGNVTAGEGTWIGIGATVSNSQTMGPWTMVGGGATVVTDLPGEVVATGLPARVSRRSSYF
jgi:acetyltransferase EpsM